jgi:hypothetical protein
VKTARKPTTSTNSIKSINRYISAEQMIVNSTIKSTYDIKSVHAQKYRLSKSGKKKKARLYFNISKFMFSLRGYMLCLHCRGKKIDAV